MFCGFHLQANVGECSQMAILHKPMKAFRLRLLQQSKYNLVYVVHRGYMHTKTKPSHLLTSTFLRSSSINPSSLFSWSICCTKKKKECLPAQCRAASDSVNLNFPFCLIKFFTNAKVAQKVSKFKIKSLSLWFRSTECQNALNTFWFGIFESWCNFRILVNFGNCPRDMHNNRTHRC